MGNTNTNVYAKFCCTTLFITKALGIFRELITTTTTTTTVAFWDPPSGSKNSRLLNCQLIDYFIGTADGDSAIYWQGGVCLVLPVLIACSASAACQ